MGLCMTCRFFEHDIYEHLRNQGNCKRNPPVACYDAENDCGVSIWPLVTWFDWCGEHQTRQEDTEKEGRDEG